MAPSFDIEGEEAETREWDKLMSSPGNGDDDPSTSAEAAHHRGLQRYLLLDGVRQGIVNLFATSLYHLFEQQLLLFLRRECLEPYEANDHRLFSVETLRRRLLERGVNLGAFQSWGIVEEARLVANAVKYGEGRSAKKWHLLRLDFFRKGGLPGLGQWELRWDPRVFQPLAGRDLYLKFQDVRAYMLGLMGFWNELSECIRN
jgi:hypothetical protein